MYQEMETSVSQEDKSNVSDKMLKRKEGDKCVSGNGDNSDECVPGNRDECLRKLRQVSQVKCCKRR